LGDGAVFLRNAPLPVVGAVLKRCQLFLGHDSGLSHLAGAVGVPSVLLFGPTDPAVWAPTNPQVRTVVAPGGMLDALPVEPVLAAARLALAER
jgi:heptosyltransferase-2